MLVKVKRYIERDTPTFDDGLNVFNYRLRDSDNHNGFDTTMKESTVKPVNRRSALATAVVALVFPVATFAHHGFGLFDRSQDAVFTGTIKSIDFVNPHSYLYLDADTADGGTIAMRCEMRAATLMRRSGWSKEMFVPGARATIR